MANYPQQQPPPGYGPPGGPNYGTPPAGPPKKGIPTWLLVLLALGGFMVVGGGIMATLAIYGMRKYIANAKGAEAVNTLRQIDVDAVAAFEKGVTDRGGNTVHRMCPSASAPVPANLASVKGKKYQSTSAEWNADQATNGGFYCLKFVMGPPQYFRYRYIATGSSNAGDTFVADAEGDLAGDGNVISFRTTGQVTPAHTLSITQAASMK